MGEGVGNLSLQLDQAIEVTNEGCEIATEQSHPNATCQVIKHSEDTSKGEGEERGNDQVKSSGRDNTGQLDNGTPDDIAIIIVIDIATGKPGVIGRHV